MLRDMNPLKCHLISENICQIIYVLYNIMHINIMHMYVMHVYQQHI